jgi:hypothetical protein
MVGTKEELALFAKNQKQAYSVHKARLGYVRLS